LSTAKHHFQPRHVLRLPWSLASSNNPTCVLIRVEGALQFPPAHRGLNLQNPPDFN
jgi:hypothetical protein